jgi:hypothetical protein
VFPVIKQNLGHRFNNYCKVETTVRSQLLTQDMDLHKQGREKVVQGHDNAPTSAGTAEK